MVVATGSASAQVRSPAPGSSFEFRCNLPGTGDFVQRYTVDSVSGGIVTVSVTDHRGTHSYSKATYLNGTTMFTESRNAGVNASMSGDLEDFGPLARLEAGWRETGWINERRDDNQPDLRWHYTVTVSGKETIFNEAIGESEVVVIEEDRWANLYSSKMYSQIAPNIGFPVFWQYTDSNGVSLRCELAALTQPGSAAPVAARASAPAQARTSSPPAQPSVRPVTGPPTPQQKLAVLDDLLKRGLITKSEYQGKLTSLNSAKESHGDRVFASMQALNRSFRQKRISAQDFIQRRTKILARVNARDMEKSAALELAKNLVDERLISQVEYTRKRIELTEAN
tara:strand:+ start:312 stop:1328 length:1017 start_codon:yes stop_codon:yes gene_type:complete